MVLAPALATIWVSRVLTFLAFPRGTRFPDTSGYTLEAVNFTPGWLIGNLQRPWPTPVLYAVLPSDSLRVLGQLVLSGAAWTLLIIVVASLVKGNVLRLGLALTLALLASTPFVLQWDTSLLAPSLMQSSLVALLAFTIRLFQQVTWTRIALTLTALAVLGAAKGPHLVILVMVIASLGITLRFRMSRTQLTVLCLAGAFIGIWSALVSYNVDRSWPNSYSGQTALWLLGGQSSIAEPLSAWLSASGAPTCVTQDAPYMDLYESVSAVIQDCPDASGYLRESMQVDVIEFLVSHPIDAAKLLTDGFGASVITNGTQYGSVLTVVPASVSDLFFGSISPDPRDLGATDQVGAVDALRSGQPFTVVAPQLLWLMIGLGILLLISVSRWAAERRLSSMLIMFTLALLFTSGITVIAAPTEWPRQLGPYWVLTVASAIVAVGLGLSNRSGLLRGRSTEVSPSN